MNCFNFASQKSTINELRTTIHLCPSMTSLAKSKSFFVSLTFLNSVSNFYKITFLAGKRNIQFHHCKKKHN